MLTRPEESKMSPQTKIGETEMLNRPKECTMSPQTKIEEKKDVESLQCWDLFPNFNNGRCKNRFQSILLILIGIIFAVVTYAVVYYYPREPAYENSVQKLYENQNKVLQDIGCSPKPEVKNMLNFLPEKDDIGLGDYEIEERFIVIFQCNDHSSFCEVNVGKCRCEPTENGQTNATAIIKFRDRHSNNSEWQYVHRTLNIMNHIECVAKVV